MFRKILVGVALVLLAGCETATPSLSELDTLPEGIRVTHSPNPVRAQEGGRSKRKYTWLYNTTVSAIDSPVVIEEFGGFEFRDGQWRFANITGKPYTPDQFAEWYSCPGALLERGNECSDPQNWTGYDQLHYTNKTLWYFIGRDVAGNRVKGQAMIELLGEIGPSE